MTQSIAERWAALFEEEYPASRRIIGALPDVHHPFKPHAKSMAAGLLAWHIAGGFKWDADLILSGKDLIVEPGYTPPPPPDSTDEILRRFDQYVNEALPQLRGLPDGVMDKPLSLCAPDGSRLFTLPTVSWLYRVNLGHMIHHRGQLTVYLRLLDIPVPGAYGPSADE